jgi:hypothetical protein
MFQTVPRTERTFNMPIKTPAILFCELGVATPSLCQYLWLEPMAGHASDHFDHTGHILLHHLCLALTMTPRWNILAIIGTRKTVHAHCKQSENESN